MPFLFAQLFLFLVLDTNLDPDWYQQPFDEIKHRHTLNEVGDVAEGRYDWKIDRGRCGISL